MDEWGIDTILCLLSYWKIFLHQSVAVLELIDCHTIGSVRKFLKDYVDTAIAPGECPAHIQAPDVS